MPKLAIISGGSRGIGLAVAKYLAQEGYDLALIAKTYKKPLSITNKKAIGINPS